MDGCTLEDAFPGGPYASANCIDNGQAEISRRQEKKKARRCRGPALTYLNEGYNMVGSVDPDRPSTKPMPLVPALNKATGMTQHAPVSQQYNYESFVGGMDSLPSIRKDVEGPTELQPINAPAFFGASPNDDGVYPGAAKKRGGLVETFTSEVAPFVNVIGTDETYTLQSDFSKTFSAKGATKAESVPTKSGPSPVDQEMTYLTPTKMLPNSILPYPNVDMFWKNSPVAGGQSSFFSKLQYPSGEPTGTVQDTDYSTESPMSPREVLGKLDKIFARLDDMESGKSEHAQTEVLLFIMTGLGVIFLMDIGCRAAASMVRRR